MKQETPSCPLCQHPSQQELAGLFDDRFGAPGNYDIARCPKCDLGHTWPMPGEETLKAIYEEYYNWTGGTRYWQFREKFFSSSLYKTWLKLHGDVSFHLRNGSGRLLDVGCNEGRGLAIYSRNGFEVEGLELNERAAAEAKRLGYVVHTTPLARFDPRQKYDVVVLANVLEHFPDPHRTLGRIRNLLVPGGEVWISCPNVMSIWQSRFGRHWINWHVPYHLWHFSPRSMEGLLRSAGYQISSIRTFTPVQWVIQSLLSKIGRGRGRPNRLLRSPLLLAVLMLPAQTMAAFFPRQVNPPGRGDCLVAIGKAP